jgi:hypothetical protein
MTSTNGRVTEDGDGGDEMKWQEVIRGGRGGTGRGGRSGRGGDGGRGRTPNQEDRKTQKPANTTILKNVATLLPINETPSNEQDGTKPMETETVNSQKKRALSMDKMEDETPDERTKTVQFDFSEKKCPPPGKYDHLTKEEIRALVKERGEQMIEESTVMETQMKIEFNIGNNVTKFSVRQLAVKVLEKMKAIDPTIALKSVQDKTTVWKDMAKLPSDEAFGTHFNVREETSPRGPRKVVVHCRLISTQKLGDIKFEANLLHYLRENKIWLNIDRFEMRRLASPGFFIDMHPRLTNLKQLHGSLSRVMERTRVKDPKILAEWRTKNPPISNTGDEIDRIVEGMHNPIPDFHLQSGRRAFGAGDSRVETDCLIVQSAAEDATYLKALLASVYENQEFNKGMFIPTGIHLIESPAVLCSLLRRHNKYLQAITAISIFGLKEEALDSPVTLDSGEVLDLKEFLLKYVPGLAGIEETNKSESEGKWFFMVKKAHLTKVTNFLDKHLKEVYEQFVNEEDLFPDFPYPRRAPAATSRAPHPVSTTVGTYASVLRAYSSNPQEDGDTSEDNQFNRAPERPRKRQAVQLVFDNSQFPKIQETAATSVPTTSTITTATPAAVNVDQKLADMEQRLQLQINSMQAAQDAQMKTILEKFEENVKTIVSSMESMMKNVHQMANLPLPPQMNNVQNPQTTGSHVGKDNTNMSSLADRVDNSSADETMN